MYCQENRDCTACGNDTCHDMAVAIFNGFNNKNNCIHYNKDMVDEEQEKLRYLADHDQTLGILNRRVISGHYSGLLLQQTDITPVSDQALYQNDKNEQGQYILKIFF